MDINEARTILGDLEAQLATKTSREVEIAVKRRQLSYDANTGDAGARKSLEAANKEASLIGLEIENLRFAIQEAKRRLSEAERREDVAAARANAGKAQSLGDSLLERARKINAALEVVAKESQGFAFEISALNRLGVTNPRVEQFTALGELALLAAVMNTPLKIRHLAPGERRTFTELAKGWGESVNRQANALLGKEAA